MGYIYDNETGEFRPTGNTSHNNTSSGGYVYDDETGEFRHTGNTSRSSTSSRRRRGTSTMSSSDGCLDGCLPGCLFDNIGCTIWLIIIALVFLMEMC
jgi:hypothetical protein